MKNIPFEVGYHEGMYSIRRPMSFMPDKWCAMGGIREGICKNCKKPCKSIGMLRCTNFIKRKMKGE